MGIGSLDISHCSAVWRRTDLHLHSPGVNSFRFPPGSDTRTEAGMRAIAESYARALHAAGIEIAAITDYQGIRNEWFTLIRDAAESLGVTVLPGAELFFLDGHGYHILTIFETDTNIDAVNGFLDSLNQGRPLRNPDGTHSPIIISTSRPDAILQDLKGRFNCLVVVPHAGEQQGIAKALKLSNCLDQLAGMMPDAFDHPPTNLIQSFRSSGRHGPTMDGLYSTAVVEFSDAHSLDEIGAKDGPQGRLRQTYLKLSSFGVDALRLALRDPQLRVRLEPPGEPRYDRIVRMRVESSAFLGNMEIEWSNELNSLIGGRGVGKSAIVETLRYALDMPPYAEQSYRESLLTHALGSGGRVTLWVSRQVAEGRLATYRVTRVFNEPPEVYDESGALLNVSPRSLFGPPGPPAILGQREIAFICASNEHKLRLVDEVIGEGIEARAREVSSKSEGLRKNAAEIVALGREVLEREECQRRLKDLQHQISVYGQLGITEKLREATEQALDRQRFQRADTTVSESQLAISNATSQAVARLGAATRDLELSQSSQRQILLRTADSLDTLAAEIREMQKTLDASFAKALVGISENKTSWEAGSRALQEEILRIKQDLRTDMLDPDRIIKLQGEVARLTPYVSSLSELQDRVAQLRKSRSRLLDEYRAARDAQYSFRAEQGRRISEAVGDRIRIIVSARGQKEQFEKRLRSLLKGSNFRDDNLKKIIRVDGIDGLAIAGAVREGPESLEKQFGLSSSAAQALCRWFSEDESRLFNLETIDVDDRVELELEVEGTYRPMTRLSIGQMATALLLLLLAQKDRLLVLDQPEEDLDNRFIYQDIVSILRNHKGRRQLIIVTHNANIVVLGDAEMIIALDVKDNHANALHCASVDDREMRRVITGVMEGGKEAFRLRVKKYGGGVLID